MSDTNHEVCVCAALQMPDGYIVRGHRHNDCLRVAARMRVPTGVHPHHYARRYSQQQIRDAIQGFLTTHERFVDRHDGLALQLAAGRLSADLTRDGDYHRQLYSEDLY